MSLIQGLGYDAASSFVNGAISNYWNTLAQDRATEASERLMGLQAQYQRKNNLDAYSLMRQSKERAGLNVNADQQITPSLSPPQSGQTALGSDTSSGNLLAVSQDRLQNAQAHNLEVDAKLKERELRGRQNADDIYSNGSWTVSSFRNSDGIDEIQVLSNREVGANSKEGFEAMKDVTRWVRKDMPEISASQVHALLNKYIDEEKITNGAWRKLAMMPAEELNNILSSTALNKAMESCYFKQGELYVSQKDLNEQEKQIREDSNLARLIEQVADDFHNGDFLGALGSILKVLFFSVMQIGGAHVSFSVGRSSSKSVVNSTSRSTSRSTSHVHTHKH